MADAVGCYCITARNLNPIPCPFKADAKSHQVPCWATRTRSAASSRRNEPPSLITKKKSERSRRRLVTISTSSDGRWNGKWRCDYIFSLQQLQLQDLAEEDSSSTTTTAPPVSITLCIHKHASFGLSVDGRIITSFTRKCSVCSSPYYRNIDTEFNVWILPSSRHCRTTDQMPEIGEDDPSVIYVKPGCEAELDPLIQDTIRLATAVVKETCSDSCANSEPRMQHVGEQEEAAASSIDGRWSRLLELRNNI